MILEVDRMIMNWLGDATNGVNALLPSTPRNGTDPQPVNVALITSEMNDGDAARGELPAQRPVIVVSVDMIQDLDGQIVVITADGKVKVRIRIGLDDPATADGLRDLSYYMRTATRSFRRLMESDEQNPARSMDGIYLETCDGIQQGITWATDQGGGKTVSGYIMPTVQLRDNVP